MPKLIDLVKSDFNSLTSKNLAQYKRVWAKQMKTMAKNSQISEIIKKIDPKSKIIKHLTTRKVRSLSGVTPFAVMTKPYPCPGKCVYCPLEKGLPKSYLSDEPAAQRALKVNFDPRHQVLNRLRQLKETGHPTDKIEIIVIGGTFSSYPDTYRKHFILEIFNALNRKNSTTLKEAHKLNEKSDHRVVGLSIETRPDWITKKEVKLLRSLGVTKLQVGVQALDGNILKKIARGHSIKPVTDATRMLKNAGLKVCYHYMPNLPGSNPQKDIDMAKKMYQDRRFKPDFVKIYPCQVIPQTPLFKLWKRGDYQTYKPETLLRVLTEIKRLTPKFVRIDRLVRDISRKWVASGTRTTNLRQLIKVDCKCIRCREVKDEIEVKTPKYTKTKIETLGATEYFLEYQTKNNLFALLRLRLPNKKEEMLFTELENAAIIREVHTFGKALVIGTKDTKKTQHKGMGKDLIKKAEQIAKQKNYKKMAVISAIGTREYYKKLGYTLEGLYMTKKL